MSDATLPDCIASIAARERLQCIAELEAFAKRYVAENNSEDGAKAQGWAILQAAHALRPKKS